MAMIASDANNPEFVGAHNPDTRLSVRFYVRPIRNMFESEKQKKDVFNDVEYVEIKVPGDMLNVIDTPAQQHHKDRFPLQWAHFQNTQGKGGELGTPLSEWGDLTPAQVEELRHLKFYTVEHIANASDAHISNIGMLSGMSAYKFRDKARAFLKKPDASVEIIEQLKKDQAEQLAKMQEQTDAKFEQMMEILKSMQQQPAKRGPKPKQEE